MTTERSGANLKIKATNLLATVRAKLAISGERGEAVIVGVDETELVPSIVDNMRAGRDTATDIVRRHHVVCDCEDA